MENEFNKSVLKDLMFDCPEGKALKNCLTKNLRKLSLKERLRIISALEKNEVDFIIQNHRDCRFKRKTGNNRME